jgi:hypothetical protein
MLEDASVISAIIEKRETLSAERAGLLVVAVVARYA